jgi:hypothetical protein
MRNVPATTTIDRINLDRPNPWDPSYECPGFINRMAEWETFRDSARSSFLFKSNHMQATQILQREEKKNHQQSEHSYQLLPLKPGYNMF